MNFFEDAISKVHYLDSYIAEIFNKEYRRVIEFHVDEMVRDRDPSSIKVSHSYNKITFAVLWSYNNPCQQHLLQIFNDLPLHIRNGIKSNMEKSAERVAEYDSWFLDVIGSELTISGFKKESLRTKNR